MTPTMCTGCSPTLVTRTPTGTGSPRRAGPCGTCKVSCSGPVTSPPAVRPGPLAAILAGEIGQQLVLLLLGLRLNNLEHLRLHTLLAERGRHLIERRSRLFDIPGLDLRTSETANHHVKGDIVNALVAGRTGHDRAKLAHCLPCPGRAQGQRLVRVDRLEGALVVEALHELAEDRER